MKNYRFLIPVLLILAYVGSIFYLYKQREKIEIQYNEYLKVARENRRKDIPAIAKENYLAALGVKDTLELRIEMGEFYYQYNGETTAIDWGYEMIDKYSKEARAYEYLTDMLIRAEDYSAFFNVYEKMTTKKVTSSKVDKYRSTIEYAYYYGGGEYGEVACFAEGVCPVRIADKWGFASETDSSAISISYKYVGSFSDGLAPVVDQDGKAYFINLDGDKMDIIENMTNIEILGPMEAGKATIYNGKDWGIYTKKGEKIISGFENMSSVLNGYVAAQKNGSWQIYDTTGELVTEEWYNDVKQDEKGVIYRNERMFVKIADHYYMVDGDGKKVTDTKYESADVFRVGDYAAVKVDGKWGFVNNKGEMVIEPTYDGARSFNNGFAAVKVGDKWGYINTDGVMRIQPTFHEAKDFTASETAFVRMYDEWSMILLYRTNH